MNPFTFLKKTNLNDRGISKTIDKKPIVEFEGFKLKPINRGFQNLPHQSKHFTGGEFNISQFSFIPIIIL